MNQEPRFVVSYFSPEDLDLLMYDVSKVDDTAMVKLVADLEMAIGDIYWETLERLATEQGIPKILPQICKDDIGKHIKKKIENCPKRMSYSGHSNLWFILWKDLDPDYVSEDEDN